MIREISFELKRQCKSKMIISLVILVILLGFFGLILTKILNRGTIISPEAKLVGIYNSYMQFGFLFYGTIFAFVFSKDYSLGIYFYLKQIGQSVKTIIFSRFIVLFFIVSVPSSLFILIYSIFFINIKFSYIIYVIICTLIAIIWILAFSVTVSVICQSSLKSIVTLFISFLVFNLLNYFLYGIFNPADSNSLMTFFVRQLGGLDNSSFSVSKLNFNTSSIIKILPWIVSSLWICLMVTITVYKLNKNRK